jgi:signal transduction histidine kinase
MGVESLWNAMPPSLSPQKEKLNELIVLIEKLGDKIRSISSDLRPDLLDDLGLVPTLQWYIKEFQDQHPEMKIRFQTVGFKKRLSASEVELTLYRIFQESLNNIVKHAQANEVHVMLTYSYPQVIFMVKDNGMGFDPKRRSKGIGLIGMRERVASANGQIDVRSKTGKGTAIRVEIPVPEPKQDAESQRLSAAVQ